MRFADTRTGAVLPKARLRPGASVTVPFSGYYDIPGRYVKAVTAAVSVVNPTTSGTLAVAMPTAPTKRAVIVNFAAGRSSSSSTVLPVSNGQTVLTNNSPGTIDLVLDVTGYYLGNNPQEVAGAFGRIEPVRLLDTRAGNGAPRTRVAPGGTVAVTLAGRGTIPRTGVAAVTAAVSVVAPTGTGTLSLAAADAPGRRAVVLNFTAGRSITTTANLPLSPGGRVLLTNTSNGTLDLVADATGWFLAGRAGGRGTYEPIDPARLLDTRTGNGIPKLRIPARASVLAYLPGRGGIPPAGVATVTAGVSVVAPAAGGTLVVTPHLAPDRDPRDGPLDPVTILQFTAGQSFSGSALLPIGAGSGVVLTNRSAGPIDLVVDAYGYTLLNGRGGLPYGWNAPDPLGDMITGLTDVSCDLPVGPDQRIHHVCTVVAQGGGAVEYDNGVATRFDNIPARSVGCGPSCIAIGDGVWSQFDGERWTDPEELPGGLTYDQIDCWNSAHCLAVSAAKYANYDTGWFDLWRGPDTFQARSAGVITDMSCGLYDDNCLAAGTRRSAAGTVGTVTLISKGTAVSPALVVSDLGGLEAVSCVSARPRGEFCVATGTVVSATTGAPTNRSFATYLVDGVWTLPTVLDSRIGRIRDISCAATNFCTAVDERAGVTIFDGSDWGTPTFLGVQNGPGAHAVHCSTSGQACAVINGNDDTITTSVWPY
ncbi:hypothetical protein GIS00_14545 [Nakamurella sp. YIM 132087]|uniref:Uncharacterized protein n=1 Tax=Nakamurella alba TaxID=2665158 RepID=A0A7K1FM69_9ACTN|nr:hypothetical protein [Nakamurella alba]MTD15160.1 hypothetical protein [Nakamurella alba]